MGRMGGVSSLRILRPASLGLFYSARVYEERTERRPPRLPPHGASPPRYPCRRLMDARRLCENGGMGGVSSLRILRPASLGLGCSSRVGEKRAEGRPLRLPPHGLRPRYPCWRFGVHVASGGEMGRRGYASFALPSGGPVCFAPFLIERGRGKEGEGTPLAHPAHGPSTGSGAPPLPLLASVVRVASGGESGVREALGAAHLRLRLFCSARVYEERTEGRPPRLPPHGASPPRYPLRRLRAASLADGAVLKGAFLGEQGDSVRPGSSLRSE